MKLKGKIEYDDKGYTTHYIMGMTFVAWNIKFIPSVCKSRLNDIVLFLERSRDNDKM